MKKTVAIHLDVVALGEKPGPAALPKGGGLSAAAEPPRLVRQAPPTGVCRTSGKQLR